MNVAIIGSRDFPELKRVKDFVAQLAQKHPDAVIVSGGAPGVDTTAELAATRYNLRVVSFRPEATPDMGRSFEIVRHERYADGSGGSRQRLIEHGEFESFGKAAYFRNSLIVREAEQIIAFHDDRSRGTQHALDIATSAGYRIGKNLHVFLPTAA